MRFQQDRQQATKGGTSNCHDSCWRGAPGEGVQCVVGSGVHKVSKQLVAMLVQDSLLVAAISLSEPLIRTLPIP